MSYPERVIQGVIFRPGVIWDPGRIKKASYLLSRQVFLSLCAANAGFRHLSDLSLAQRLNDFGPFGISPLLEMLFPAPHHPARQIPSHLMEG